jgi:hypothetical protein
LRGVLEDIVQVLFSNNVEVAQCPKVEFFEDAAEISGDGQG